MGLRDASASKKKRWKKKEWSNSELWAATPKTVNILYLEQHERKYNTDLQQINFNAVGFRENYGKKVNKRNAMYAKKQRKLVKGKLFGPVDCLSDTQKFVWSPDDVGNFQQGLEIWENQTGKWHTLSSPQPLHQLLKIQLEQMLKYLLHP